MASLAGRSLISSYKELLKLNNASLNSGISGSLQGVEDGFAGATALQISNAAVASTGTLASTGDFSVATNKLTVAAASGNTAVAGTLSATGDLAINTNKFTVAASSGNTVVAGTLNVSGTSTLASVNGTSGSFSSTLASTGDFSVATNKFNVTAASGNTAVAGTLSSAGDFSVATNKLTVAAATGNTAVAGTLSATGNLAINTNKFNVTASNGNTSVAGTLTVSDYADFSSTGAIRVPRGLDGERPAGQAGMLRFNTASQVFEGHNGVLWGSIGSGGGGGGSSQYVREKFTATSGQTSFTITGGYTPERIDVFQNGIKLVNGDDVTVTSGTSIVLTTGAVAGDVIDVVGLASGNFAGPATAKRQNFTATAGQTVFTVTGGYTPGQLDVFQNGTKLLNAVDVDVSNGSTFTLTTGANLNDTIEVVGFTAADTISGTLKFQAGTAAAPSITTFGDTNTGLFFPAADTIAFSEGGTESMRIDSSGRVGIGTGSPRGRFEASNVFLSGETGAQCVFPLHVTIGHGGSAYGSIGYNLDYRSATDNTNGVKYLVSDTISQLDFNFGGFIFRNAPSGTGGNTATLTERLRITSGGLVCIGTSTGIGRLTLEDQGGSLLTTPLTINSTSGAGDRYSANFYYSGTRVGSITVNASATAFNTSSDYRLKTNLEPISNGIDRIKQLPVYRFNWIADQNGSKVDGFVAHEVTPVVPEAINGEKDAVDADGNPIYQGIDQSKIVPLLTAALKEAIAKIETLETNNTALESRIAALEAA